MTESKESGSPPKADPKPVDIDSFVWDDDDSVEDMKSPVLDAKLIAFLTDLQLPASIYPFLLTKRVLEMPSFSYFLAGNLDSWISTVLDDPDFTETETHLVLKYYPRLLTLRALAISSGAMVNDVLSPEHPQLTAAIYAVAYARDRRPNITLVRQAVTRFNAAAQLRLVLAQAPVPVPADPLNRSKGHPLVEASRAITNPGSYNAAVRADDPKPLPSLHGKHTWDGKRGPSFDVLNRVVLGWLASCNAGYLIDPAFVTSYGLLGTACLQSFPHLNVSPQKLKSDTSQLYGTLTLICRNGAASTLFTRHESTQDGILTWRDIVASYAHGGNPAIAKVTLMKIVQTCYSDTYPGGLEAFVDNHEEAYTKLAVLGRIISDADKLEQILTNLTTPDTLILVELVRDKCPTFTDVVQYLRSHAMQLDHMGQASASRKARLATSTSRPDTRMAAIAGQELSKSLIRHIYTTSNQGRNRDYVIPKQIWLHLSDDMKKAFSEARALANTADRLSSGPGEGGGGNRTPPAPAQTTAQATTPPPTGATDTTGAAQIPRQYGVAPDRRNSHLAARYGWLDEEDDDDDAVDSDDDDEDADERLVQLVQATSFSRHAMMARTESIDIRAHLSYLNLATSANVLVCITDDGADSTIFGNGWHITEISHRVANLVGFDATSARKHGLPICNGITAVDLESGTILLQVHEGVHNKGSKHTLISEFQVRNHGCILDSVAKQHRASTTTKGTQSFMPNDETIVPLNIQQCLMTFQHRMPTEAELDSIVPIDITSPALWIPSDHYDDPYGAPHLSSGSRTGPTHATTMTGTTPNPAAIDPPASADIPSHPESGPDALTPDATVTSADIGPGDTDDFHDTTLGPQEPDLFFFDAVNSLPLNVRAFHLSIDYKSLLADPVVDGFLDALEDHELTGHSESFETFAYVVRASEQFRKAEKYQAHLAYLPLDVIKRTFDCTTQLATTIVTHYPMRRHMKSRFPQLNRRRLSETVATDTYFSNYRGLRGHTCAQVFFGLTSHMINVYGMRTESEFPGVYQDFLREEGAPSILRRDNSQTQTGKKVTALNRDYVIGDQMTEPHHPQQNPAEMRAVRWLKEHTQVLLDRTGAPHMVWLDAQIYLAKIHNIVADPTLDHRSPKEARHGETPDISKYLLFKFYQKIWYLDTTSSFPDSKEKAGYWLGPSDNVGDGMTFKILADDTETTLYRSVIRPFDDPAHPNNRVSYDPELDPELIAAKKDDDAATTRLMLGDKKVPIVSHADRTQRIKDKKASRRETQRKRKGPVQFAPLPGEKPQPTDPITDAVPTTGEPTGRPSDEPPPSIPTVDPPTGEPPTEAPTTGEPPTGEPPTGEPPIGDSPAGGPPTPAHDSGELADAVPQPGDLNYLFPPMTPNTTAPTSIATRRSTRTRTPTPKAHDRPTFRATMLSRAKCSVATLGLLALSSAFPLVSSCPVVLPTHHGNNPGKLQTPKYRSRVLTTMEADRLRYIQDLDILNEREEDDPDDRVWKPTAILKHKARTVNPDDHHTQVNVLWNSGGVSWVRLNALRMDDPYISIQYGTKNRLSAKPDWLWMTDYIDDPQRMARMARAYTVSKETRTFKFGIEVARTMRHALYLDKLNGDTMWQDSIDTELRQINAYNTFREPTPDDDLSKYQRIPYHLVFDVKFDLRRKARLVAGGHQTDPPKEDVYSGVVAMETVRMGFVVAAMNGLQVCAADVGNAFLYGITRELVYVVAGPEFGHLEGRKMIIYKGLYGLKSSGARFHEHLAAKLRSLGYKPSRPDPDFWIKKIGDRYEYIATYVDDILAFGVNPMAIIDEIKKSYVLKGVGVPEYYLGGNVDPLDAAWNAEGCYTALSARTYIANVSDKFETMLGKTEFKKVKTPMMESYHPELDDSALLDASDASKFRALIGSGNWLITLGRFDIHYAVQALSRYNMAPREGHIKAAERIFAYLKHYPKGKIVCDPHPPDHSSFESKVHDNWKEFYPDAEEELPPGMPEPLGKKARFTCYVDADHAHDVVTRRSVTGIILLLNSTPIRWVSKRQKTVETSTYGSELVAARMAVEVILEYRYHLRMIGVPIDGPTLMLGDNNSVVMNTTIPSSVLKKKHNAVAYHRVREACAANVIRFVHIPTETNYADILTKPLGSEKFYSLVRPLLFRQPKEKRPIVSKM
jgi:hypothetical protein